MKRRNIDSAKMRRTLKKNRISEGFCSSSLIYLKILFVWAFVMMADFLLDFRFEYFWPTWLLLRSIYDSFRYQGVAFSVFFVCVTITSDMICFIFVPVQWLFFLASTYVWVQYVWHADRGVCLPTVTLWLLFVYVEASVRLKELKMLPFTLDLCRPFAAHCIGYPVVTLGFGVKSYVSYRLRLRKQKEVCRDNEVYSQVLTEALPAEYRVDDEKHRYLTSRSSEEIISNGAVFCNNNAVITYNNSHNSTTPTSSSFVYHQQHDKSLSSSTSSYNSNSSSRLTKNYTTASSSTPTSSLSGLPKNSHHHPHRKISNGWLTPTTENGILTTTAASQQQQDNCHTNGLYNNMDVGGDDYDGSVVVDDDEEDNDYGGNNYVSTNSSTLIGWLSSVVAKFFGLKDNDDDECGGEVSSSKNPTAAVSSDGVDNTTWTSSMDYCKDSDDESRASKDSRDSVNTMITMTNGDATATKKSSHLSVNGVKPQQTKLNRRRGGSSPQFSSTTPNSNVAGSLCHTSSSSQQLATKDINSTQVFGQKEKVQDKDLCLSLESDIEKLKNELRSSRSREQELRRQINDLVTSDKSVKNELQQQKQQNEQLQIKLQNLVRARQQDKQTLTTLEKRVVEEQKLKSQAEQALQLEKKQQKKLEEANAAAASKVAASTMNVNKPDCTEACKLRRREIENQIKQLRRDLQQREEQFLQMESEIRTLRQYKETNNVDVLMSALSAMQDKNQHLETSLSAETRIKLDLFSVLGDAKRQLEITNNQLMKKDQELEECRRRLNQHFNNNQMFFNSPPGLNSPLTPPPSVPPTSSSTLDGSFNDLMSPTSMYSTPSFMSSMNGLMFDDGPLITPTDYANISFVPIGNNMGPMIGAHSNANVVDANALLRFTPPRSSNNSR